MVHSAKSLHAGCVAALLLHVATATSLVMALSHGATRLFLPRRGRPRPALLKQRVGCVMLGRDVGCRVSLTCHSAICERGGDGHPGGLL